MDDSEASGGLDYNLLPGRVEQEARLWRQKRARLKSLAEMKSLVPPSEKDTELAVLGMMVDSHEQLDMVAKLLEREDFYCEELGRLFELWKRVAGLPRGNEERKRAARAMVANGVSKATAAHDLILAACSELRALRRQRRIDSAKETIYLHDGPDWEAVVQREWEAVRAIKQVTLTS